MRQITDQNYEKFTANERAQLTMAALARNDISEADRLWETCPKFRYECRDINYANQISTLNLLSSFFFRDCVRYYNNAKMAEHRISEFENEIEQERALELHDIAAINQKIINLYQELRIKCIARLKALFAGFKQFCDEQGYDSDTILKPLLLEDCCHDLDSLLASEIEMDGNYANQIKKFYLENWNF